MEPFYVDDILPMTVIKHGTPRYTTVPTTRSLRFAIFWKIFENFQLKRF